MPQLRINKSALRGDNVEITGTEAHHLIRVLRAEVGDIVELFDGEGGQYKSRLTKINPQESRAEGKVVERRQQTVSPFRLKLFQGLPKGPKFDYVIEKASELGAHEIIPFLSQKSDIKLDAGAAEKKVPRWYNVAEAASKQSGRGTVPRISPAVPLKKLEPLVKDGVSFVFSTAMDALPFKSALHQFLKEGGKSGNINVIVGPESGFSSEEEALLVSWGATPVSLGKRILRTETIGLAVLSILNYDLDLFSL
jgi:16S rRNA (uracil1498-N3)-methyltransferase